MFISMMNTKYQYHLERGCLNRKPATRAGAFLIISRLIRRNRAKFAELWNCYYFQLSNTTDIFQCSLIFPPHFFPYTQLRNRETVFNVYRRATFRGLFVFTWKWRAKRFDPAGVHVLFNSFSKTSVKLGNTPLADSTSEAFGFSLVVNIHGSNATLFQVKLYLSMG